MAGVIAVMLRALSPTLVKLAVDGGVIGAQCSSRHYYKQQIVPWNKFKVSEIHDIISSFHPNWC